MTYNKITKYIVYKTTTDFNDMYYIRCTYNTLQ